MKKIILTSLLIALNYFSIEAQVDAEKCASSIAHSNLIYQHPEILEQYAANEKKIQAKLSKNNHLKSTEKIYTIPVVVHVIHLGEAVGVGNNISDAQIISGINQLSDAYRNTNGLSIDMKIQFALAKIDANCNPTSGIVRVNGSSVSGYSTMGVKLSTSGASEIAIKDLSRWPNSDYYNVWLVSEFDDNNGGNGVQGFAYFPGTSAALDGAMIMNTAWGNTGTVNSWNNQGSTGIHEIGHALNLYHTFEGDNGGTSCPADGCGFDLGDCCDDTSPHIRSISDCSTSIINPCTGKLYDNVIHNYMDYSNQICQYGFTNDQKDRMRAALETSRAGLTYSKAFNASINYTAPIAPICSPVTSPLGVGNFILGILYVEMSNLHYTSGYAITDKGYLDVTDQCLLAAEVDKDSTYTFKVSVGANVNNVKAWIDYNNDGEFSETSELIYDQNLDSAETGSVAVTIPSTAVNDTYLRMRVMNEFGLNSVTSSCLNPIYGQAEDYSVFIRSVPLSTSEIAGSSAKNDFVISPNPFNDFVEITSTDVNPNFNTNYSVVDLSGAVVITGEIPAGNSAKHKINTQQLKAGSYILLLQNQDGQKSGKIVKLF